MVFTQHGHSAEELRPPYKNQLVRRWGASGSIKTGTPDWELIPEITKTISERMHVLKGKNTYDAFINTNLEEILEAEGVKKGEVRVVVCGVMTDCCCDTTGRAAFNRGFETWLVKDACGTATPEQHEAGLRGFGYAFGDVVTTRETIKQLM
jgi:nicotinamidase-related amidase